MSARHETPTMSTQSSALNRLGNGQWLDLLPTAAYLCAADGAILHYNGLAARLWGIDPGHGALLTRYTGARLLAARSGLPASGQFSGESDNPVALALSRGSERRGQRMLLERRDGTHLDVVADIAPVRDECGVVDGAICLLHETGGHYRPNMLAALAAQRLAAIVESSSDAIIAKDLDGFITSWNQGAERLFGYTAEEVIGEHITIIFPPDRLLEEDSLVDRIRRGERIDHFETVRRRKDGTDVEISLTVSPIFDQSGQVMGASKIARDITSRKRDEEQKDLLLREMNHRVKNLFALSSGLVSLSARKAQTVEKLVADLQSRFAALARAHTMTLPSSVLLADPTAGSATTLHTLIITMAQPYIAQDSGEHRVVIVGPDLEIANSRLTSFALILHEFATNAAKYGALAHPDGRISITCQQEEDIFSLVWQEESSQLTGIELGSEGFGSQLARITVKGSLNGEISRCLSDHGLKITLTFPLG
jgi:PAS domain S-box-containing protein